MDVEVDVGLLLVIELEELRLTVEADVDAEGRHW